MKNHVKILFEYHNNFDGDYHIESAWSLQVKNGYQLKNILFYAPQYSYNDVVEIEDREGELYVTDLVQEEGHSTVRVLFSNKDDVQSTRDMLKSLGCDSELSNVPVLIAVDIPPSVSYLLIRTKLDEGEQAELWEYEEACISSVHKSELE